MKQHYSLLVLLLVFLSSCVVIVDSTNANFQDELYYSSEEYALEDAKDEVAYQQYLKENEVEEESIAHEEELYEEQFDYEDCYDYYYTSRLRRFHSPHLGFGYYNNYYTNSFWYSNKDSAPVETISISNEDSSPCFSINLAKSDIIEGYPCSHFAPYLLIPCM